MFLFTITMFITIPNWWKTLRKSTCHLLSLKPKSDQKAFLIYVMVIDENAFDELSYAFHFDASFNLLTNMSQVPMKYQKGIKLLNVSYNQIQAIPKSTFPKLYELASIDFSHNNITDVGRSVFASLFSIRHLNFRYSRE